MRRLLRVWRRHLRREGPEDRLLPHEVREVGAAVRKLSLGLTRERELVGSAYMERADLLGAYLLYFWPVSHAQGRSLLGEIGGAPGRVLDLGAGPAPLAFAAFDAGAREVTAAERSPAALRLAGALAEEAGKELRLLQWNASEEVEGTWDRILLGHVLNELWERDPERRAAFLAGLVERLAPGGRLLVVEPALRETSRDLLQVRDRLLDRGLAVRAPCLFRGPCPALEKEGDWCHEERAWEVPPIVRAIAGEAGLRKDSVKMSYLVVSAEAPARDERRLFRIVSEPLHTKGRLRYVGCGPEGRVGLALPERRLGGGNRAFASLERGDVISVSQTEEKGDGLALSGESLVERVARVGEPFPP